MSSSIIISISSTLVYYVVLFFLNKKSQVIHLNELNKNKEVFGYTTATSTFPSKRKIQEIEDIEIVPDTAQFQEEEQPTVQSQVQDKELVKDKLQDTTTNTEPTPSTAPDSLDSPLDNSLDRANETTGEDEDYEDVLLSANELSKSILLEVNKEEFIENLHFIKPDTKLNMEGIEAIIEGVIRKKSKVLPRRQENYKNQKSMKT